MPLPEIQRHGQRFHNHNAVEKISKSRRGVPLGTDQVDRTTHHSRLPVNGRPPERPRDRPTCQETIAIAEE